MDGLQHSWVCSAAAEMAVHRASDLDVAGLRSFRQKFRRFHDHAVIAVAALCRLLVQDGLLHGVKLRRLWEFFLRGIKCRQTFEGRDCPVADGRNLSRAGPGFRAVDEYGTGSALTKPATESRTAQLQLVYEDVEQGRFGRSRNGVIAVVDANFVLRHARYLKPALLLLVYSHVREVYVCSAKY